MSQVTPTTQEVAETIVAQLEGSLSQSVPLLPKSFVRVLAKTLAGGLVLLYKYASFIFLQLFVAHASMAETTINGKKVRPLVEWFRLFKVGDPYAATRAELVVAVTVLTQSGDLPARSQVLRSETGVVYETVAAVPLDAATVHATIRATSDPSGNGGAGAIGNLEPGEKLAFAKPLSNVAGEVTVVSEAVTGADEESPAAYRARGIKRIQRKPQGGAYADYQAWAEEVPGIVAAYPYTGQPGQVDVYVEATPASSGSPDGIATSAQLTQVSERISLDVAGKATRRPANAAINVLPITRTGFDVTVGGLSPDTPELRSAIQQGVDEHLRSREPFIVGLSVLPRVDRVTEAAISGIVDTIVAAAGASVNTVSLPLPAYTLGPGEKAKLGNMPFV